MAIGPGKYDAECTQVRESTNAQAVVLIVLNGNRGAGFSVQATLQMDTLVLSDLLEHLAHQIRKDVESKG